MKEPAALVATPSQTIGPFFHFALTDSAPAEGHLGNMARRFAAGERVRLIVRVNDGNGDPVSDGLVELTQGSVYGRLPTGPDGTCEFDTMRPGTTSTGDGRIQASHIDLCFFARGLLRQLQTRIYFAGDPAIENDQTLALVPLPRRATLLASPQGPAAWVFHLRLQGPAETVFFDV